MSTERLTILHINDMHGDFFAELRQSDSRLIGGLALLSGYLKQVRAEEDNVLFVIAGDLLQGSPIDREYRGISTIEIMNYLAPDVATVGNHDFDYGLPHALFLDRVANFPFVNSNLHVEGSSRTLFRPYFLTRVGPMKVLFTGAVTEKALSVIQLDDLLSQYVRISEPRDAIDSIVRGFSATNVDLTVLLTHIGFDSDVELARSLAPDLGIDLIIGGHSHTVLAHPADENGILIAQAGVGTKQVGRFDLVIDTASNRVVDYTWDLVPIVEGIAEPDAELERFIDGLKQAVRERYDAVIARLANQFTHPSRMEETTLGNLAADAMAHKARCDVAMVAGGGIRGRSLGPLVTYGDLTTCFPYADPLVVFKVTGEQLHRMFDSFMRPENRTPEGEFYEVNRGVKAVYDDAARALRSLEIGGTPVMRDGRLFTLGIAEYHSRTAAEYLGVSREEMVNNGPARLAAPSMLAVFEEYIRENQSVQARIEGRLVLC